MSTIQQPLCPDCRGTGIIGDEGPGMRNALHEWHPCECPAGRVHRPQPEVVWTDAELDAIAALAKEKDMSPAAVIRQALRVYQIEQARATRGWEELSLGCGQLD